MAKILSSYYGGPWPANNLLDRFKRSRYSVLIKNNCYIHQMRNRLISGVNQKRKQKFIDDVYFWIDADIEGSFEDAKKLIELANKYYIIGAPYRTQKDDGVDCCGRTGGKNICEVPYIGFGFLAIHSKVFNALEFPYFEHPTIIQGDCADVKGEDIYFCEKALKAGFPTFAHYDIKVKHHIRKEFFNHKKGKGMKKITIPEIVAEIKHSAGTAQYPFSQWVDDLINSTKEFGNGVKVLRKVNELSRIIEDADKEDKIFILENEYYKLLSKATETPIGVIFGRKAESAGYYKAVEDAEQFTPEVPKEKIKKDK